MTLVVRDDAADRAGRWSVTSVLSDPGVRLALTYFTVAQLLDILTTVVGLFLGLNERNPVTSRVIHQFGGFGLLLEKVPVVIAVTLAVAFLPRRVAIITCWVFTGLMAAVVAANIVLVSGV